MACLDSFDINSLSSATNGFEQFVRFFAHKYEHGAVWRFLDEFQEFVGAFDIHSFRKPDDRHLVSPLA